MSGGMQDGGTANARDTALLRDYMNEHYAAARHQQTLRVQSLALLFSASNLIFIQAILNLDRKFQIPQTVYFVESGAIMGFSLISIAIVSWYFNKHFHQANRYHIEVAKRARNTYRDQILLQSGTKIKSEIEDPNLIGEAVRLVFENNLPKCKWGDAYKEELANVKDHGKESKLKLGELLHRTLYAIPLMIGSAGCILLVLTFLIRYQQS
jgi:hypothetical protein